MLDEQQPVVCVEDLKSETIDTEERVDFAGTRIITARPFAFIYWLLSILRAKGKIVQVSVIHDMG